ncbi:UNVERIFIED_CONTAM: hypothetical protein NCL1_37167 [Trichonephila clavipes]
MTSHYNLRSREKSFSVGDEVLILMPSSTHKLLNTWIGPAKVVKLTRPHSSLVQIEDGSTRELHVNKLKPYISRVDHVGVIFDKDSDFSELHYVPTDKETQPKIGIELNQMTDVLNSQQKYQLRKLLQQYEDIFRNRPGKANVKVGACLAQNDENGMEHPIAFYSRKLTKCQMNWSTIEREAYAVLSALKKFDCWIFGSQI